MSNSDTELKAVDAAACKEERGAVLEVLGGVMLFMAGITCVWIWVGWRAGTWFWFWCTAGLGLIGTMVAAAGMQRRARAAKDYAAWSESLRSKMAASSMAEELPVPDGTERRAA
jgi:hypothetical protein